MGKKYRISEMNGLWKEIVIRMFYVGVFLYTERMEPFRRQIQPEEMWMYKYPHSTSYVPITILWPIIVSIPILIIGIVYYFKKDVQDTIHALLAISLALAMNGAITNVIKVSVGRPRPDYYWRCYPDGIEKTNCTGPQWLVYDGRKSFPSGHSSMSFAAFGFISLYLADRINAFSNNISNNINKTYDTSWKLTIVILPLLLAMGIAISRTCDYHHHWQDVTVGSILGFFITYICYRLYFNISNYNAQKFLPITMTTNTSINNISSSSNDLHEVMSCPALVNFDLNDENHEERELLVPKQQQFQRSESKWL